MEVSLKKRSLDVKKVIDFVFYMALTIEIIIVILTLSDYIVQFESYWFRLTFILFGIKVFFTKYSIKEWATIILFCLLGTVSYFVTGRNEIIRIVMFIAACKGIEKVKLMKYTLYTTLAGCLILIALSIFGIGILKITAEFRVGRVQTRYCLGMGHPNGLHCMFWAILTLCCYSYRERLKWYHYLGLMILNILLFLLTDSRTGVIISVLTILTAYAITTFPKHRTRKVLYVLGIVAIIGCVLISIAFSDYKLYDKFFSYIDEHILSYRVLFTAIEEKMQVQNWALFGLRENQKYTDLGYVKLAYWYGILPALIYVFMCCRLVWVSRKTQDYMAALVTVVISIYTVVEAHDISVYIARNYILFFFGMYWNKIFYIESVHDYYFFDIFRLKKLS